MGCGGCGGGRVPMAAMQGPDGQQMQAPVRASRYVVRWVSAVDASVQQVFDGEDEARDFIKAGNPGSLIHEAVSPR